MLASKHLIFPKIPKIIYTGGFIACILTWMFYSDPILRGWETNTLFLWNSTQWEMYAQEPHQFLMYFRNFMAQFYALPLLGILIYTCFFWLIAFLINTSIEKLRGKGIFPWGYIGSLLCLPSLTYTGFILPSILFLSASGAFISTLTRRKISVVIDLIYLAMSAYLLREYALIVLLFMTPTYLIRYKVSPLYIFLPILSLVLSYVAGYLVMKPYNFFLSEDLFHFLGPNPCKRQLAPFYYFSSDTCCIISTWMAFLSFPSACILSRWSLFKSQWIFNLFGSLSIILIILSIEESRTLRLIYHIDKLMEDNHWDEAMSKTMSYWKSENWKEPPTRSTTALISAQTKICLIATNQAGERFFTLPTPHFPMLFPERATNMPESYVLPHLYRLTGNHSECLNLAFDHITSRSYSIKWIRSIIESSLIMGDTLVASKFIHLLEQTLSYRKEANDYKNKDIYTQADFYHHGIAHSPTRNYPVYPYDVDFNINNILNQDIGNRYIQEYFITLKLLKKDLDFLQVQSDSLMKFYGSKLPIHLQEALLSTYGYMPVRSAYPSYIQYVNREVWNNYWNFLLEKEQFDMGRISFHELQKKWQHTYWFYHLYLRMQEK